MLDLIGTISLIALAVVLVAMLIPDSGKHGPGRTRIAAGLSAWFILAASLGLAGAFMSPALPTGVAVGIAALLPVIALAGIVARTQAHGIPLTTLVAVHVGRILGGVFLVLYSVGRLPYTFAHSAGWGDVATAVLAIPVVWAIRHRVAGWRWFTAAWNVLGLADLLAAVVLGIGSAPGSLVRFIYEAPGSGAIVTFPWVLVPAFFVPLYMLTHVAVFAHLAAPARTRERGSSPAIGPISPAARASR